MQLYTAVVALSCAAGALADLYTLSTTIAWTPKQPASVDQSVVFNSTYYLSDRSNAGVHVIPLAKGSQTAFITGFVTGYTNGTLTTSISGPNGLVVLPNRNEIYAGDGDGTIKVIDLFSNTIVANITTGSKKRADEFAYDPASTIVVGTNANESPPSIAIINATSRVVIGHISVKGASGLEQPRFHTPSGTFYISVPGMTGNEGGAVISLNLANAGSLSIGRTIPTPKCDNTGIVFGPTNDLFVGCGGTQLDDWGTESSYIYDLSAVVSASAPATASASLKYNISSLSGIDQVAYSPSTNFYYASAYQYVDPATKAAAPFVAILSATNGTILQKITTDNTIAHSVAVDEKSGAMIIPTKAKGILIYTLGGNASATATTTGSATGASASASATGAAAGLVGSSALALFAAGLVACAMVL
jgi:hypothetical protein